jgi:adenylate cyclase
MSWQGEKSIQQSKERISKIDKERQKIDTRIGRVEPNIDNVPLGGAIEFDLAVLHIDINSFKRTVRNLDNDNYLRLASVFLTEITQLVKDFGGNIDRFVGDQVTALFGIGISQKLACQRAAECALTMQTIIRYVINPYLSSVNLPIFTCSVSIDFGEVWMARIGIKNNNEFTLIGATVLIAAELLDYAKEKNTRHVVMGEQVYDNLPEEWRRNSREVVVPSSSWTIGPEGVRRKYKSYEFNAHFTDYPIE